MKKTIQTIFASLLFVSPMQMAAQNTAVDFSQYTGSQVVNSDFEDWSGPEFDNVPFGWHSFESVDGAKLYVILFTVAVLFVAVVYKLVI